MATGGRWHRGLSRRLGEIRYFDVVVNDADGNPAVLSNVICLHEEDHGVAWKHTDLLTGATETRRQRRLVLSCIATANNYEYGFYWYFYVDGTIQFEVKLTGILSTGAVLEGASPPCGTLVAPGLYAPNHRTSSTCAWICASMASATPCMR